jgi:hypothetical protein
MAGGIVAGMIAAHADWSKDPRKRWVAVARRNGRTWRAEAPVPVGDPAALAAALIADGPATLGLDLPIGLPRGLAAGRAEPGFPAFLAGLAARPDFFEISASLATVSPERPFYPARPARGMTRASHAAALGLDGPDALNRACDRATRLRPAGAPLVWTLGANQSGRAAIAAWRDWLAPALAAGAAYALWPFDGGLHALQRRGRLVLAECYPAEAMRTRGIPRLGSKRSAAARRATAPALRAAMAVLHVEPDASLAAEIADGFGPRPDGEDRFDSLIGLLGVIAVLDGAQPDHIPDDPWIRRWEGWVLGQTEEPS